MTAHEATIQLLYSACERLKRLHDRLRESGQDELADDARAAAVDVSHAIAKASIANSQARMGVAS